MAKLPEAIAEEITADFLDAEDEILAQLEHELGEAYNMGIKAMTKVIKTLEDLPKGASVGDMVVKRIMEEAEREFHRVWSKEAFRILGPQFKEAMKNGVLQGQTYTSTLAE